MARSAPCGASLLESTNGGRTWHSAPSPWANTNESADDPATMQTYLVRLSQDTAYVMLSPESSVQREAEHHAAVVHHEWRRDVGESRGAMPHRGMVGGVLGRPGRDTHDGVRVPAQCRHATEDRARVIERGQVVDTEGRWQRDVLSRNRRRISRVDRPPLQGQGLPRRRSAVR